PVSQPLSLPAALPIYLARARPLGGHQLCGIAVEQVDPMLQPVHILPFEAVEDELPDVLAGLSDLADVVGIHHADGLGERELVGPDRKSTRLNSSHVKI